VRKKDVAVSYKIPAQAELERGTLLLKLDSAREPFYNTRRA